MSEPDDLHRLHDRIEELTKRLDGLVDEARRASRRGNFAAAEVATVQANAVATEIRASVDHLTSLVRLVEAVYRAASLWATLPAIRREAIETFHYDWPVAVPPTLGRG